MNLETVLIYLEAVTEVAAVVPSPAAPFAPLALQIEKILQAAVHAKAATTGKTVEEVIAQLHQITPVT